MSDTGREITKEISNKIANLGVVGALMVVFIHIPKCETGSVAVMYKILPDGLLGSAVMMFFTISGYLIAGHVDEKGWWKRECFKRVRTLFIPYLILNLFYFGVMVTYHSIGAFSSEFSFSIESVLGAFGLTGESPVVGPLWYVRSLLLSVLIFPVFVPLVRMDRWIVLVLWLFFVFGGLIVPDCIWKFLAGPLSFGGLHNIAGFGYFLAGAAFRIYGLPTIRRPIGAALMAVAFSLSLTMVNCENIYMCNWLNSALKAVMVVSLWSLAPEAKWSRILTANSFCVYSMHWMITHPSWLILEHMGLFNKVFGSFITLFPLPDIDFRLDYFIFRAA